MRAVYSQLVTKGSHTVTVGAGGATQTSFNQHGNAGNNSSFGSFISCTGGGYGAYNIAGKNDNHGGSGGGGQYGSPRTSWVDWITPRNNSTPGTYQNAGFPLRWGGGGKGTADEGHDGGQSQKAAYGQAGGGGAGETPIGGVYTMGGNGGDGLPNDFRTGSPEWYAGGGGGSAYREDQPNNESLATDRTGQGGRGGGGKGGQYLSSSVVVVSTGGDAHTGSGGGGAEGHHSSDRNGYGGGSGIIVVRLPARSPGGR